MSIRRSSWVRLLPIALVIAGIAALAVGLGRRHDVLSEMVIREPMFFGAAFGARALVLVADAALFAPCLARAGTPVPFASLLGLSGSVVLANQILPAGGVSGTLLLVRGFEKRGAARGGSVATAFVTAVTFYAAWFAAIALAVAWTAERYGALATRRAELACISALSLGVGLVVAWSARSRWPILRRAFERFLAPFRELDRSVAFDSRLLALGFALQMATFALEGATLWLVLRAFGSPVAPGTAMTTAVLATFAQIASPVANGLGAVEGAIVLLLERSGIPIGTGIAAAIVMRLLQLFVPIVPALFAAREEDRLHRLSAETPSPSGK